MITVLTCRGTGEVTGAPTNMLAQLAHLLDPAKYEIGADIPYPAAVGPVGSSGVLGPSEAGSVAAGLPLIADAIRATPNLVGLCGYSLGAELVSAFLEAKARGEYADCELAWAAVIANPNRAPGESIDPMPVGSGINGPHGPWPAHLPVFSAANPGDGITSCPDRSPLRALAHGMSAFSFATLGGWTESLAQQLISGEWMTEDYSPGQLLRAGQLMLGYLLGGQHTTAYVTAGYLLRLADHINAM
ncbi:hypothetical protein [Nocardia vaccinii]|uniref:hypothetical protein n=1 Tax=Nocardia vaccinii TaxID=1822 RepID=UPI0008320D8A|nr:hypothetical protein [Nocardia vaccinii]